MHALAYARAIVLLHWHDDYKSRSLKTCGPAVPPSRACTLRANTHLVGPKLKGALLHHPSRHHPTPPARRHGRMRRKCSIHNYKFTYTLPHGRLASQFHTWQQCVPVLCTQFHTWRPCQPVSICQRTRRRCPLISRRSSAASPPVHEQESTGAAIPSLGSARQTTSRGRGTVRS